MGMELKKTKVVLEGFSVFDMISFVYSCTKKSQAKLLSEIEVLVDDPTKYRQIRKLVLDVTNDFSRDIVENLFGEVNE